MANAYGRWYVATEQDVVPPTSSLLCNLVGWYLIGVTTDTTSDRNYIFLSEGEEDDGYAPRMLQVRGNSNYIYMRLPIYGAYNFFTGAWGEPNLNSGVTYINSQSDPERCAVFASKDRVVITTQPSTMTTWFLYSGFMDSFYSPTDCPSPVFVAGQHYHSSSLSSNVFALNFANAEIQVNVSTGASITDNGAPNVRDGSYCFFNPIVYYNGDGIYKELHGRMKGCYMANYYAYAYGSYVQIGNDYYYIFKSEPPAEAIAIGPVNDYGTLPTDFIRLGFLNTAYLKIDYTYLGFVWDDDTLALWRFDTGHLGNYLYGSGATLPVPSVYGDETGIYTLLPKNGMTSVESRLREAADFDGAGDYVTGAGSATVSGVLNGSCTYEFVFKPDTIPTGSGIATLFQYGSDTSGNESLNDLMCIDIVAASGTTPNDMNVELGNISLSWEYEIGSKVRLATASDFVQQDRWNYLAVVKVVSGPSCAISIWHCSFGDHRVPKLKKYVAGLDNSTGGDTSSWYMGAAASLANFYDGQLDDTRIMTRALTDEELLASCRRAML